MARPDKKQEHIWGMTPEDFVQHRPHFRVWTPEQLEILKVFMKQHRLWTRQKQEWRKVDLTDLRKQMNLYSSGSLDDAIARIVYPRLLYKLDKLMTEVRLEEEEGEQKRKERMLLKQKLKIQL
ncbi:hypothetical protein MMC32_008252 [Xylographa parallela]|nr:hypothetical protein [Xylographa parallela]